jgi:hypothetical protein
MDRHRFDANPDPDLDWHQNGKPDPEQKLCLTLLSFSG